MYQINAGRELDALIAKEIFDIDVVKDKRGLITAGVADYYDDHGEMILYNPIPLYSIDIAAAWDALEKIISVSSYRIETSFYNNYDRWECTLRTYDNKFIAVGHSGTMAAEALCLAALNFNKQIRFSQTPSSETS